MFKESLLGLKLVLVASSKAEGPSQSRKLANFRAAGRKEIFKVAKLGYAGVSDP